MVKREVRESEPDSVEFKVETTDDVEPDVEAMIMRDPRQLTARVAAEAIRQPPSAASSEEPQRPGTANYWMQPLCSVPSARLGPTDPPRRPGRPKGSRSRPWIAAVTTTTTPPVRLAAAKANVKMAIRPNRF